MDKKEIQKKLARITELRDNTPGGRETEEYQDLMDQMLTEATGFPWKNGKLND